MNESVRNSVIGLREWLVQDSLPLWIEAGYDHVAHRFRENVTFFSEVSDETPLRVMVQARQIATYARAHLEGVSTRGECAADAFNTMRRVYWARDGQPGWAFSCTASEHIHDARRDLYAHAFVVYACAWLYRLTNDPVCLTVADQTLEVIDRLFADGMGAYVSEVGQLSGAREQNPHMHLLEAVMALYEASGRDADLERARIIVGLWRTRLRGSSSGLVLEVFDNEWRPAHAYGDNPVEPGHQFEWVWLLREYERLTGENFHDEIAVMRDFALAHGCDAVTGKVCNGLYEDGRMYQPASRTWPQTEAIRALLRERNLGWSKADQQLIRTISWLRERHLPLQLRGGWYDKLKLDGTPEGGPMPASTLYHVAGAVFDGWAWMR